MKLNCAIVFLAFFTSSVWVAQTAEENYPDEGTAAKVATDIDGQRGVQELECSSVGGICMERANCPVDKVSKEGKCSKQNHSEAVCCHGLSLGETVCQNLGGYCRDACPEEMIIIQANDCETGEKCCPLV